MREKRDLFLEGIIDRMQRQKMIDAGDCIVAGVSGGADSVCLLAILAESRARLDVSLTAVHVEHGIRGEESLQDAAFVETLCREWQIDCRILSVDAKARAREKKESLEEAARYLRYEAFRQVGEELKKERGLRAEQIKIAVAHNQNDQAETVLMNLARGSGLRGLCGIRPVRRGLIRPLLDTSREEIEQWLLEQKLGYCTDQTNGKLEYTRNRIRLVALPWLTDQVNQEAVSHLAASAKCLQRAEEYIRNQAEKLFWRCILEQGQGSLEMEKPGGRGRQSGEKTEEVRLFLPEFLASEEILQEYVLQMAIEKAQGSGGLKDFGAVHIEALKELAGKPVGRRLDLPGGLLAVRKYEWLLLCRKEKGSRVKASGAQSGREGTGKRETGIAVELGESGLYRWQKRKIFLSYEDHLENIQGFPEKKYTKWLACDTISHILCVRTRRPGDYLVINAQGGRKKLKDYFIDEKIPREQRDQILLVASGSHILWVVGYRLSWEARVTENTEKIAKIQIVEEEP